MSSATLLTAGVLSAAVGATFLVVGRAVSARAATDAGLLARRAHTAWWLALGAYLILHGALTVAASRGALTAEVYYASRFATIPLLMICVWGITSYILFLYRGDARLFLPVGLFFAAVGALFFYASMTVEPTLRVRTWLISGDDSGALYRLVYALVGLPPILATIAYLALLPKVEERAQRYRIVLVAGSILAYIGSGLAARLAASDAVIFVTLVLFGLAAALASLAAYYPPAAVRRWLGEAR